ncbi:nucleotidyltransferase family protein [Frigoribacterium sp. SL97]|uniref:nucleotidyltransferase family protein n=1 Tax=Frigoribacterium sp. SL97 TaxID=2994664 RepID=UPI00226F382B|nr:NDP-sugar synthase [Frigoribacterium sp. SL97]WAC50391.1 NDP-sugar synthase [Frigoribacterium sp. SL97]
MTSETPTTAVVLCAGRGTRLGDITATTPKPLVLVGEATVLEDILGRIRRAGVKETLVTAHHLADRIEDAVRGHDGVTVTVQERLTGPAGSLIEAVAGRVPGRLLVIHGDLWSDVDLRAVLDHHECSQASATVVAVPVDDVTPFGALAVDGGALQAIRPKGALQGPGLVNAGIYVFETDLTALIENVGVKGELDFHHLFAGLIAKSSRVSVVEHLGRWFDVGTPASLLAANRMALDALPTEALRAKRRGGGLWSVSDGPRADAAAPTVIRASLVFDSAALGDGVVLSAAVIGAGAVVCEGARVERSVLLPGAVVAPDSVVLDEVRGL